MNFVDGTAGVTSFQDRGVLFAISRSQSSATIAAAQNAEAPQNRAILIQTGTRYADTHPRSAA